MERTIRGSNAGLAWFAQAISGLLLIVLLFLHIIANHFVVQGGLQTYRDVVDYLGNPLILVLETVFLLDVMAHAMLGVRSVLFDTGLSRRHERTVTWILAIAGLAMVAYALWLTNTIIHR